MARRTFPTAKLGDCDAIMDAAKYVVNQAMWQRTEADYGSKLPHILKLGLAKNQLPAGQQAALSV